MDASLRLPAVSHISPLAEGEAMHTTNRLYGLTPYLLLELEARCDDYHSDWDQTSHWLYMSKAHNTVCQHHFLCSKPVKHASTDKLVVGSDTILPAAPFPAPLSSCHTWPFPWASFTFKNKELLICDSFPYHPVSHTPGIGVWNGAGNKMSSTRALVICHAASPRQTVLYFSLVTKIVR
jgi:hypothetical protein